MSLVENVGLSRAGRGLAQDLIWTSRPICAIAVAGLLKLLVALIKGALWVLRALLVIAMLVVTSLANLALLPLGLRIKSLAIVRHLIDEKI